jgi:hypothetical protein
MANMDGTGVVVFLRNGSEYHRERLYMNIPAVWVYLELSYKLGYPIKLNLEDRYQKAWEDCGKMVEKKEVIIRRIHESYHIWDAILSLGSDTSPLLTDADDLHVTIHNYDTNTMMVLDLSDMDGVAITIGPSEGGSFFTNVVVPPKYFKVLSSLSGSFETDSNFKIDIELRVTKCPDRHRMMKCLDFINDVTKKNNIRDNVHFFVKDDDDTPLFYTKDYRCDIMATL